MQSCSPGPFPWPLTLVASHLICSGNERLMVSGYCICIAHSPAQQRLNTLWVGATACVTGLHTFCALGTVHSSPLTAGAIFHLESCAVLKGVPPRATWMVKSGIMGWCDAVGAVHMCAFASTAAHSLGECIPPKLYPIVFGTFQFGSGGLITVFVGFRYDPFKFSLRCDGFACT